jgi:hypothetical protein
MILFQVDGRYTKNIKYSLFFNPFFAWKEKEKKKNAKKGLHCSRNEVLQIFFYILELNTSIL